MRKVFLSSTARDLDLDRQAVVDALLKTEDVHADRTMARGSQCARPLSVCEAKMRDLLRGMGRLGEAVPLSRQALAAIREALGNVHPSTRTVAANDARLLRTHSPDDPALAKLTAAFGDDIGT